MNKILVTGSTGMLGQEMQTLVAENHSPRAKKEESQWSFLNRNELDLEKLETCPAVLQDEEVRILLNFAAYTQVDQAEKEAEKARTINETGPKNLAHWCRENGIRLIHISTDYVYGGAGNTPFREDAPVNPAGVYAQTKAAGEAGILATAPDSIIVRTSWLYGPNGNNFLNTMLRLGREKESLQVVNDQIGSPTYTLDLAGALIQMIEKLLEDNSRSGGIYNYSNEGTASWFDFAWNIMQETGLKCRISPCSTDAFPRPAPRPAFSLMSKEKIRNDFGINIPHWQDGLRRCLKRKA
ncbi:MAG: dTDP-4-dehydrorhamnose reductase [Bacteroidetes bacterium]|nr:dTDP-4-dehydrorhamnose reductase [Bacteroidota bacterium]